MKYKLVELTNGWAVAMSANTYIVESFTVKDDALQALTEFEDGKRFVEDKPDVWVIGESFVTEPGLGGMQIGEVSQLDMNQFNVIQRITQDEYDDMMERFAEENGHYPDE